MVVVTIGGNLAKTWVQIIRTKQPFVAEWEAVTKPVCLKKNDGRDEQDH